MFQDLKVKDSLKKSPNDMFLQRLQLHERTVNIPTLKIASTICCRLVKRSMQMDIFKISTHYVDKNQNS